MNLEPLLKSRNFTYGLLFVFAALLYGNTLFNDFNIDDDNYVQNCEQTHKGFAAIPEIIGTNGYYNREYKGSYRALPRVTFAIQHQFFGESAPVGHAVNVIIYGITAMLVFAFIANVFAGTPLVFALLATLLFLAHPVHAEAVCSLKNREVIMDFLFGMGSALAMLRYYKGGSIVSLLAGAVLFLFALMSKESGQQFFAIIPLALFFSGTLKTKKLATVVAVLGVVSIAFWLTLALVLSPDSLTFMANKKYEAVYPYLEHPLLFETNPLLRLGTALYATAYYVRLLIVPYPLGFFYGYSQIPVISLLHPIAIAAAIFFTTLLFWALWQLPKKPIPAFGVLLFFTGIAMFSNIFIPISGVVDERHAYQASLGYSVLLAWAILKVGGFNFNGALNRVSNLSLGLGLIVLVALSVISFNRTFDWKNPKTLAAHDVPLFPNSAIQHMYYLRLLRAECDTAAPQLRPALVRKIETESGQLMRICPPSRAYYNYLLGQQFITSLNMPDSALTYYQLSLQQFHTDSFDKQRFYDYVLTEAEIQFVLADCYARLNAPDKAIQSLAIAGSTQFGNSNYYQYKLDSLGQKYPQADTITLLKEVIKQNPLYNSN